jgi:medium-chain acyl-[acyl-carrier-protein] hydrolase
VQPPGRGNRYKEPPYTTMDSLVSGVAREIKPFVDRPFSFFGHSVGSFVSFELAHRLAEELGVNVSHLFVSGARGPQLPRNGHQIHHLPENEFITELKALDGTPPEVLENPELIGMFIETLRADFAIAETYTCSGKSPLNCPISAFGGLQDNLASQEDLEAWKIQTTNSFDLWQLPGDHFFIHTSYRLILEILSRQLAGLIS